MSERDDPLGFERLAAIEGLALVRQPAPAGARSFAASYVGPAGWGFDPPGTEGLARLTSHLVTSAAGRFDRVELARRLDRAGATLSSQCAPESAEVTVWGPSEAEEELLGLLAEVVLRPRFDVDDVAHATRQLAERQLRERSQPASRADRELLRAIFPKGHPYRETGLGDARSLTRLRRPELVRFHRAHYTSEGGLLVVTTSTRPERLRRLADRLFGEFPGRRHPPRLSVPPIATTAPVLHEIRLAGRTQVEVRFGGPTLPRSDPEYPAAFLANELLGGRPLLGRLFQSVREKEGLAYHASSDLEAMTFGGYWVAQAGTGADRWRKVVKLLARELSRLREETVPTRELSLVRESAIGEIPLSLETTSEAHELAVDAAYHGLAEDHWRRWPERLRAVTPREVREAARVAFPEDGSATVVAGPLGAP